MKKIIAVFLIVFCNFYILHAEEGMYPISEVHKINLKKIGLLLDNKELYNPNGISLVNAIVRIGGCSGSFVSDEGLIITNHHCVFGSLVAHSTKENDLVTNGFLAKSRAEELPTRGQTVKLIESYADVTEKILHSINDSMESSERAKVIEKKMREISDEAEKDRPGYTAEVAEMMPGKKYILFIYFTIRDVRLVYAPPRSIGDFGGEIDNWTWPRHTGDFAYARAYVAPDGSPAVYSTENIPYRPKNFLKVNPNGANENDVVFILGFPGRTFRHRTSDYIIYEESVRLPFIAEWHEYQINTMKDASKECRTIALKYEARIKSLANVAKNFRGKLQGLERLQLASKKQNEEKQLQEFINASKERKNKYGKLFLELNKLYNEMKEIGTRSMILDAFRTTPTPLANAITLNEAYQELAKPDSLRLSAYTNKNIKNVFSSVGQSLKNYYKTTDKLILKRLFSMVGNLPTSQRITVIDSMVRMDYSEHNLDRFLENAFATTQLTDSITLAHCDSLLPVIICNPNDLFAQIARTLYPVYTQQREERLRSEGSLNKLLAMYIDIKQEYLEKDFIPDANSTLRFTYGSIKGYSPADATYYAPITTLRGVIEKTREAEPYNTPKKIQKMHKEKDFGRFKHKNFDDLPVNILYNLDTTGGNSGSAVLNNKGEIIGVNFDRTYEATINDYVWSESYSRSIAVDIRYILWITQKFAGAEWLLKEMGVN